MKTILHTYSFNTDKPEDREPCHQLLAMLRATKGRGSKMHCLPGKDDRNPEPGPVELETEHLFSNQWNTDKGRVFDWYQKAIYVNGTERRNIIAGHYLDITPEMVHIRDHTLKCRWTGQQFPDTFGNKWNLSPDAIGSPYLKESQLHLLRLLPVSFEGNPEPLTDEEKNFLLPLYIKAQSERFAEDAAKLKEALAQKYAEAKELAETEYKGFCWLLDHGVNTENAIFYKHTNRFGFGWRNPYPDAAKTALTKALKGFPYNYDIK